MKKVIFTIVIHIILLLCISCSSDDLVIEDMALSKAEQNAIVNLISNNLMIEKGVPVSITAVKLRKINNNYYLSSYHGNSVTTTLLRVENGSTLKYGEISCTSEITKSSEEGCIPDKNGKRCTPSKKGNCTKIVTTGILVE